MRTLPPIALLALAAALLCVGGCGERGDPVQPSDSVTGRWNVSIAGIENAILELVEVNGVISGRFVFVEDDVEVAEYALKNGSGGGGGFSFTIDPLDPPDFTFLERIGNIGAIHASGSLENRETLRLDMTQECAAELCLETSASERIETSLFTASGLLDRPFGIPGSFAQMSLIQSSDGLTGNMEVTFGTVLGGTRTSLPVVGAVIDSTLLVFQIDPREDSRGIVADSIGCDEPIAYFGFLGQGSTVLFNFADSTFITSGGDSASCVFGVTTWTGREIFDEYSATLATSIGEEEFDLILETTQSGSVVEGTVLLENDSRRWGPFRIVNGRFANGIARLTILPSEIASIDFVNDLGSAAPIVIEIVVDKGADLSLSVRQDCPCLNEMVLARRLRVGL